MSDAPRRMRPLDVCEFDVVDGHVVAVDSVLPVAAVFDAEGELLATWSWPLDPELRGRPTAEDVCLTATHIVVASPAAGGVIRIERDTGAVELVSLEEDIGHLIPDGEVIWAVADPNRDGAYEAFLASPDRRQVVWEEPSAEDMERFRGRMSGWFGRAPGSDDEWVPLVDASDPAPSAADWQRDDDDEAEHIGPTTPVWRIDGVRATRVDVGGELAALAAHEGRVVAVCQLPSDPLIKAVQPGGYLSYVRPGTILIGDGQSFTSAGTVTESSGEIVIDGGDAWLLGFSREDDDGNEVCEVRRLDLTTGALSEPVQSESEVVAVVSGRLVGLAWEGESTDFGDFDEDDLDGDELADEEEMPSRSGRVVRIIAATGDPAYEVVVPRVEEAVAVDGTVVWLQVAERPALIAVDVEDGALREVVLEVDLADFVPEATAPDNLDVGEFESTQLDHLRGAFSGGWQSETGERRPFIDGVDFDSVEIVGGFPHTQVVALFHAADRPGVQFGRRWRLYDDLGNPEPLEYADIHLMEEIEAAGYGLPPAAACLPDKDGVVWF